MKLHEVIKRIVQANFELVAISAEEFAMLRARPCFLLCDVDINTYKVDGDTKGRRVGGHAFALNQDSYKDSLHCCFYQAGELFFAGEMQLEEVRDRTTKKIVAIGTSGGVFVWVLRNQSQSYSYATKYTFVVKPYIPEARPVEALVIGTAPRNPNDLGGTGHGDDSLSDADPGL